MIVLDGASAYDPATPSADQYVDALLAALVNSLDEPVDLRAVLRDAIATASEHLGLTPGGGPSSTVLLLRNTRDWIEVAALGDSTAVIGLYDGTTERLTDDRLAGIATDLRVGYRERLRAGGGFDTGHRDKLGELQRAERAYRNATGGYWIAEADTAAADHAIVRRYRASDVIWWALATDGAQRGIDHHGIAWSDLSRASTEELAEQLEVLHQWEAQDDPNGEALPRAKRHDDKTLVVGSHP
ncbi:PP2C family serine/threonine-protein phosphatase [Actinomycetes bacterium KLBMP 9759]